MGSIFSGVFDSSEPQLLHRWISLKSDPGLPYLIQPDTLETVAPFAHAELGALALAGNSSLNTGVPLTDNQQKRQYQIRETEKERVHSMENSRFSQ